MTLDDASRQQVHIRQLSEVLYATATDAGEPWVEVFLDARFSDHDGSFIDKVRLERPDGSIGSLKLPIDGVRELIALGEGRPAGADRWYGLVIRVTAEGSCNAKFDYDPASADGIDFYST